MELNIVERSVIHLRRDHIKTWRDKDDMYWLARLIEEVGELGASLVGDHNDTPEWELTQISAICINWLEMRHEKHLDTEMFPTLEAEEDFYNTVSGSGG